MRGCDTVFVLRTERAEREVGVKNCKMWSENVVRGESATPREGLRGKKRNFATFRDWLVKRK